MIRFEKTSVDGKALLWVSKAINENEPRQFMQCVKAEKKKDGTQIAATDGHVCFRANLVRDVNTGVYRLSKSLKYVYLTLDKDVEYPIVDKVFPNVEDSVMVGTTYKADKARTGSAEHRDPAQFAAFYLYSKGVMIQRNYIDGVVGAFPLSIYIAKEEPGIKPVLFQGESCSAVIMPVKT